MKTYSFNHKAKRIFALAAGLLAVTGLWSCNKDFETKLAASNKNDTANVSLKSRKVLYIIVDGVRGDALKSLNAPNLTKMARNSIHAYSSLSDYGTHPTTNAGSWANMLTGVTTDKHAVTTEDFAGNNLNQFPSLFTRLKQTNEKLRTVAIGASPAFVNSLGADATEKIIHADDDAEVKNALNNELENKDANLIVAQFHAVEKAGQLNGYSETSPAYANAILQLDAYVGEILNNLAERPNFSKENWLVVVASNKGGTTGLPRTDNTSYGDETRNNFIVFYNPRFNTQTITKPASDQIPYIGTAPVFYGGDNENRTGVVPNDGGLYNFGTNEFTLQLKIKTNGKAINYPIFLSKTEKINNAGKPGWLLYIVENRYSINLSSPSAFHNLPSNSNVNDGKWHTITLIFYKEAGKRFVKFMTDGVVTNTVDVTNVGSMDNNLPLRMGRLPTSVSGNNDSAIPEMLIKELQIYNVALPEANVAQYYRKTFIDSTHPYYNNLISYWPGDEGKGNTIVNKSPLPVAQGKNFTLTGTYEWRSFSDISPVIDPPISSDFYKVVPNNVDIPFQIYQWMGVSVPPYWVLDGKSWNPTYTDIKP